MAATTTQTRAERVQQLAAELLSLTESAPEHAEHTGLALSTVRVYARYRIPAVSIGLRIVVDPDAPVDGGAR